MKPARYHFGLVTSGKGVPIAEEADRLDGRKSVQHNFMECLFPAKFHQKLGGFVSWIVNKVMSKQTK